MKIRLSEDEVYEIKMPEEIGINEFQSITTKFNFLSKNFSKFNVGESENSEGDIVLQPNVFNKKSHDKAKWKILKENREIFIELLYMHYNKTIEEFYEFCKKENLNILKSDIATSSFTLLREMHKVKPSEVGLIRFPSRKERVTNLRTKTGLSKPKIIGEEKNE